MLLSFFSIFSLLSPVHQLGASFPLPGSPMDGLRLPSPFPLLEWCFAGVYPDGFGALQAFRSWEALSSLHPPPPPPPFPPPLIVLFVFFFFFSFFNFCVVPVVALIRCLYSILFFYFLFFTILFLTSATPLLWSCAILFFLLFVNPELPESWSSWPVFYHCMLKLKH